MPRNEATFILKDKLNKPKGVLVILEVNEEATTFGLSLLGKEDTFKFKTGYDLALNRAVTTAKINKQEGWTDYAEAFYNNSYIIRKEVLKNIFNLCWNDFYMLTRIWEMISLQLKYDILSDSFYKVINNITKRG